MEKKENKNIHRDVILVAYKKGEWSQSEIAQLREKAWKRSVGEATLTIRGRQEDFGVSTIVILDIYMVKDLCFKERCRYLLSKIKTTVASYIGINPVIVIIK